MSAAVASGGSALISSVVFFVIFLVVGLLVGAGLILSMIGPGARAIWKAKRMRGPMMLDIGRDKNITVIPARRGSRGLYHAPYMEVIPDPQGSFGFYGKRTVLVHEHSPTTLNEKFLCVTQDIVDGIIKDGRAMNDEEVADYIDKLEGEKKETQEKLEILQKIQSGVVGAREYAMKIADAMVWDTPQSRDRYAEDLAGELNVAKIPALQERLEELTRQMTVPVSSEGALVEKEKSEERAKKRATQKAYEQDGVVYEKQEPGGGKFHVFLHQLKVNTFRYFLPTGATLGDMWSHTQQALAAAKAEAGDDAVFKRWLPYIIFGVVTMMILIGAAYLVSQVKLP